MEKGENASYKSFLFFPQYFQKPFIFTNILKSQGYAIKG